MKWRGQPYGLTGGTPDGGTTASRKPTVSQSPTGIPRLIRSRRNAFRTRVSVSGHIRRFSRRRSMSLPFFTRTIPARCAESPVSDKNCSRSLIRVLLMPHFYTRKSVQVNTRYYVHTACTTLWYGAS